MPITFKPHQHPLVLTYTTIDADALSLIHSFLSSNDWLTAVQLSKSIYAQAQRPPHAYNGLRSKGIHLTGWRIKDYSTMYGTYYPTNRIFSSPLNRHISSVFSTEKTGDESVTVYEGEMKHTEMQTREWWDTIGSLKGLQLFGVRFVGEKVVKGGIMQTLFGSKKEKIDTNPQPKIDTLLYQDSRLTTLHLNFIHIKSTNTLNQFLADLGHAAEKGCFPFLKEVTLEYTCDHGTMTFAPLQTLIFRNGGRGPLNHFIIREYPLEKDKTAEACEKHVLPTLLRLDALKALETAAKYYGGAGVNDSAQPFYLTFAVATTNTPGTPSVRSVLLHSLIVKPTTHTWPGITSFEHHDLMFQPGELNVFVSAFPNVLELQPVGWSPEDLGEIRKLRLLRTLTFGPARPKYRITKEEVCDRVIFGELKYVTSLQKLSWHMKPQSIKEPVTFENWSNLLNTLKDLRELEITQSMNDKLMLEHMLKGNVKQLEVLKLSNTHLEGKSQLSVLVKEFTGLKELWIGEYTFDESRDYRVARQESDVYYTDIYHAFDNVKVMPQLTVLSIDCYDHESRTARMWRYEKQRNTAQYRVNPHHTKAKGEKTVELIQKLDATVTATAETTATVAVSPSSSSSSSSAQPPSQAQEPPPPTYEEAVEEESVEL